MPTQSVLAYSFYKPARGGHAPGDLRNAFLEAIEAYEGWDEGQPEPEIEVRDRMMPISRVCGLVWNCSDIMPGMEQRQLEDLMPRAIGEDVSGPLYTYGRAARVLKSLVLQAVHRPAAS